MRQPEVLPAMAASEHDYLDRFRMVVREGKVVGYLRIRPLWNVNFEEVIAPDMTDYRDAISLREHEVKGKVSRTTWVTAKKDQDRLKAIGYDLDGPIGDTTMAVSLKGPLRTRSLPALFGADTGLFAHYPSDDF